ncbi:glycosyltransferase family 4 protein [Poritiphilus flavus]|uniref:Glycosyltransferase n=1 Tax=Poritiphilus flavus TaxID=2697053 RepID=A0A6L9EC94_9FLAO|nr:glycosyltransferase family 4 protein [Poritiphilus flavus]NAS12360.1 glycosyltransferase [Poritiphilus flavus]
MEKPKNILVLCSASYSLYNFRGDMIKSLLENNFKVYCAAPDFDDRTLKLVHELGGIPVPYNLERTGLNPLKDLGSIRQLKGILKEHKIDLLFPYTIKPVVYGSMAAKKHRIPVVSLITGLGFTFSQVSFKSKLLQKVTEFLYRRALRYNSAVVFQNKDDLQLFLDKNIVTANQTLEVVQGSGINLDRFAFRSNKKIKGEPVRFIIVGRLIREKGVGLFIEAGKELQKEFPKAEFHIVGAPPPNNSSAISLELLNTLNSEGVIVYHGESNQVDQLISRADIFVLPSFYREGVPRSALEALSTGMPIITTDQPGCRETVVPEENGFLIPPNEQEPLTKAMRYFLDNPEKIEAMSLASRKLAKEKFDVNLVNAQLIDIINSKI